MPTDLADNRTIEYHLDKKSIGDELLIEGSIVPSDLREIYHDIVKRRFEVYPNSENVNELDYDYPSYDWATYHEYKCIDVYPNLKLIFPYIKKCLEMAGDDYEDYYFKSWINVWPKGQKIIPHRHYGTWHGYYVINDTGTTTYYTYEEDGKNMVVPLKNYSGHFTFMPAHILHWADPNPQDAMRISTGYNISTWEEIAQEDADNKNERGGSLMNIITPLKELL